MNHKQPGMKIPKHEGGFALAELLLATMIAATFFAGIAIFLDNERKDRATTEYAGWMAQYVNAVAAFVSAQGVTPPASASQTGTDWLKSTDCGGTQPVDAYFLACSVPTDFNGVYGLPAPEVTFDWSVPTAPEVDITFGVVESDGTADTKIAGALAAEINRRLEVDGYNHAGAFIVDPSIPASNAAAFRAELNSANLRGFIDTSIESTVFVRRDGNTVITGPLVSEHDNWTLIARDESGNENADEQSPTASANVNDAFIRASDAWVSETHTLAEEAYRLAARSPQFMTEVSHGTAVPKPTCPGGLTPQVYTYPVIFVGGDNLSDTRFIAGIRTPVQDNGTEWIIRLFALYEESSGWEAVSPDMGRVSVTTRCG